VSMGGLAGFCQVLPYSSAPGGGTSGGPTTARGSSAPRLTGGTQSAENRARGRPCPSLLTWPRRCRGGRCRHGLPLQPVRSSRRHVAGECGGYPPIASMADAQPAGGRVCCAWTEHLCGTRPLTGCALALGSSPGRRRPPRGFRYSGACLLTDCGTATRRGWTTSGCRRCLSPSGWATRFPAWRACTATSCLSGGTG